MNIDYYRLFITLIFIDIDREITGCTVTYITMKIKYVDCNWMMYMVHGTLPRHLISHPFLVGFVLLNKDLCVLFYGPLFVIVSHFSVLLVRLPFMVSIQPFGVFKLSFSHSNNDCSRKISVILSKCCVSSFSLSSHIVGRVWSY